MNGLPAWVAVLAGLAIAAILCVGAFVIWLTAVLTWPPALMWVEIAMVWLLLPLLAAITLTASGAALVRRGRSRAGTALALVPPGAVLLATCWVALR